MVARRRERPIPTPPSRTRERPDRVTVWERLTLIAGATAATAGAWWCVHHALRWVALVAGFLGLCWTLGALTL